VANPNLDGTGTLALCFDATPTVGTYSSFGGTIVTGITIKSTANVSGPDIVRLFINMGGVSLLLSEVFVPATIYSQVLETYSCDLYTRLNLSVNTKIYATTQQGNPYNVFINGYNYGFSQPSNTVLSSPAILDQANTGIVNISVANPNINGTGTLGLLLTAISSGSYNNIGTTLKGINIKAQTSTTQGMVRLFVYDGASYHFWSEVSIPAQTQSAVNTTFSTSFQTELVLNPGYQLFASTSTGQVFDITAFANNFTSAF